MSLLPARPTKAEYDKLHDAPKRVLPAVRAIADRHGLGDLAPVWMPGGMNMLFALGDAHVLKLFPPLYADDFDREQGAMAASAALDVPTPRVVASGGCGGWPYMLMTRVPGRTVQSAWPEVPWKDRLAIAGQLGEAIAALHASPPPAALRLNWPVFRRSQAANAPFLQGRYGAPPAWTGQIPGFLARHGPPEDQPLKLLHADLHGRNVLLAKDRGRWRLGGIIDFGDAFVGPVGYEFVAPAAWIGRGEPALFAAMLDGYGYGPRPDDFARRMMALALIHRFGSIAAMRWLVRPKRPTTLEALAVQVFSG